MKCINHSHPDYLELKKIEPNLLLLDSLIDQWQTENRTDKFPSKDYIKIATGRPAEDKLRVDLNNLKTNNTSKVLSNNFNLENQTMKSILDRISRTSRNPYIARLAERLHMVAQKNNVDFKFVTKEQYADIDPKVTVGDNILGAFYNNTVYIITDGNFTSLDHVERTILHEAIHALTSSVFSKPENLRTPSEKQFVNRIRIIKSNYETYAQRLYAEQGIDVRKETIEGNESFYGFKNEKEFLSEIMTNQEFQETLRNVDKNFVMKMVDSIVKAIVKLLGLSTNKNVEVIQKYILDFIQNDYSHYDENLLGADFKTSKVSIAENIIKENELNDYTVDDDFYTNNKTKEQFGRLTNFVFDEFNQRFKNLKKDIPNEERTRLIAESQVKRVFKEAGKDLTEEIVTEDEDGFKTSKTFDQLVNEKIIDFETGRVYGVISHAWIEWEIAKMNGDVTKANELAEKLKELAKEKPGIQEEINTDEFMWISENIYIILEDLGLVFNTSGKNDKYYSELPFVNEKLGIGTTIDGLIEHPNGTYSMFDFKTGARFTNDQNTTELLKYSEGQFNEQLDTRESKAKLELMMRAFMLKEKHPDIKFRDISVIHFRNKQYKMYPVEYGTYLEIISKYYRENDPEMYKEFKERGLFDYKNYVTRNQSINEELINTKGKSLDTLRKAKQAKLNTLILSKPESKRTVEESEEIVKLTKEIIQIDNGGFRVEDSDDIDVGFFKRWLGTTSEIASPLIQRFNKLLYQVDDKVAREEREIEIEHRKLYSEIETDYYNRYPMRKIANKGVVGGLIKTSKNFDGSGIFDFIWKEKTKNGQKGYYLLSNEDIKNSTSLTNAQRKYAQFIRKTIEDQYKSTMLNTVTITETRRDKFGKKYEQPTTKTIASILGYPETLPDDFTPRMVANMEGFMERHGGLNNKTRKYFFNKMMNNYFEKLEAPNPKDKKNLGVPVKYMEQNDYLIGNQFHSFDPETIVKQFSSSMIKKRNKDELFVMAQGIVTYYKDQGIKDFDNEEHFRSSINFLLDTVQNRILDTKKESNFTRKEFKIGKDVVVAPDKVLTNLKNWVGASSMWVQIPNGIANSVLITMLNNKEAVINSIVKRLGVNKEDIDFTMRDLTFAHKEIGNLVKDMLLGDERTNKLWLLAKEMRFLPDNYDYKALKSNLDSAKNKTANEAYLYFAHSLGENYGQLVLLAAQMKHADLYDKYEVEKITNESGKVVDGRLKWTGGIRFKTIDGRIVQGITPEEIMRMKRVSQKIHGGYRKEERTALELTALGQWVLQFKKYLPSILSNMLQSKREDISLGKWVKFPQQENGEDIYEWVGRVNEGRIRTVIAWLLNFTRLKRNKDYDFKNLSSEQKRNLFDLLISASMFAAIYVLREMAFDDDDEEKQLAKRFKRLNEDTMQGYYPMDMLRNFQTQQNVIPKLMETTKAIHSFMFEGIMEGKTTSDGYLKGQKGVMKALPFANSLYQFDRYLDEDDRIMGFN